MMPGRSIDPITPAWRALLDATGEHRRIRLQPLMRWLTREGIEPSGVSLPDLARYRDQRAAECLRRDPEGTWRDLAWAWNVCAREVEGWPAIVVDLPARRDTYLLPWSTFPKSLKHDADRMLAVWSGVDLEDDGPSRPISKETARTRAYQLQAFASMLVAKGRDPVTLARLADLVAFDAFKEGLSFLLARKQARDAAAGRTEKVNGGKGTSQIWGMATFLTSVARHWVKVDDEALKRMQKVASRLAPPSRGLTAKNRELLQHFDDDAVLAAYLRLPWQLMQEADTGKPNARRAAVRAQLGLAIHLLQMCPVRIKNLASISLDTNLRRIGRRTYLIFCADEVKNGEELIFELPGPTVDLLDWYLTRHRPALLSRPCDALFPGENGKPKAKNTLALQMAEIVFERIGVWVNPHLVRHIALKTYVDAHPGQYVVMQQVLGHRDIKTTMGPYAGAEKKSARQLYQDHVLQLLERAKAAKSAPGKPDKQPLARAGGWR